MKQIEKWQIQVFLHSRLVEEISREGLIENSQVQLQVTEILLDAV